MIIIHMGKVYNKVANFLCSFTANKYMHFIVCMILVQLISLFIPVLYAMLIVFILGLCKEIFDNNCFKDSEYFSCFVAEKLFTFEPKQRTKALNFHHFYAPVDDLYWSIFGFIFANVCE